MRRILRIFPELFVFTLALVVFLPPLATLELWDRREEHVAADSVDTLYNGNWLVSYDHGLPRLKKPPLARWCSAATLWLAGQANEFAVRLPAGLAALLTATLIYLFGRQCATGPQASRRLGCAAVLLFATNFLVISEMWVMSTEPILTAMTTLAIWSFWRAEANLDARWKARAWRTLSGVAVGLGVLTKGPIALVLTAVAVAGYLASTRPTEQWKGKGGLAAWKTLLHPLFWTPAVLMVCVWGRLILTYHPEAPTVWLHEMTIKVAGVERRPPMVLNYLPMATPWIGFALAGLALPFCRFADHDRRLVWLIWWWSVGNLVMFSFWTGAREPYYLACMPAVCLLAAIAWDGLTRSPDPGRWRSVLEFQWVVLLTLLVAIPAASWMYAANLFPGALALSAVFLIAWAMRWDQRTSLRSLSLLAAPLAVAAVAAGTLVAPVHTQLKSHKAFAKVVTQVSQERRQPVWYLNDLGNWQLDYPDSPDVTEGVWFYVSPPPVLIGSLPDLVESVGGSKEPLLLVVTDRQRKLIESDTSLAIHVLAEEQPVNRPKTLLLEVRDPQSGRLASRRD